MVPALVLALVMEQAVAKVLESEEEMVPALVLEQVMAKALVSE